MSAMGRKQTFSRSSEYEGFRLSGDLLWAMDAIRPLSSLITAFEKYPPRLHRELRGATGRRAYFGFTTMICESAPMRGFGLLGGAASSAGVARVAPGTRADDRTPNSGSR